MIGELGCAEDIDFVNHLRRNEGDGEIDSMFDDLFE